MSRIIQQCRLFIALAVLALSGAWALTPGLLQSQTPEKPCEFGGTGEWKCDPNKAHIYQQSCEGIDCYVNMEKCCEKLF